MEHLKVSLIGQAPVLPTNIRLSWKGLPGDKHSSLLQVFENYGRILQTLGRHFDTKAVKI
jgi:hypothetical protein